MHLVLVRISEVDVGVLHARSCTGLLYILRKSVSQAFLSFGNREPVDLRITMCCGMRTNFLRIVYSR